MNDNACWRYLWMSLRVPYAKRFPISKCSRPLLPSSHLVGVGTRTGVGVGKHTGKNIPTMIELDRTQQWDNSQWQSNEKTWNSTTRTTRRIMPVIMTRNGTGENDDDGVGISICLHASRRERGAFRCKKEHHFLHLGCRFGWRWLHYWLLVHKKMGPDQ